MAKSELEKQLDELERVRTRGSITEDEYQARRSAIMAAAPAIQQKKRGGLFKWGALGCMGIFGALGLLVVLVIVAVAVAVNNASDSTADPGKDVHVTMAQGASGEIAPEGNGSKRSKVTILELSNDLKSSNQFEQPGSGRKFIGYRVEVEDTGSKEVTSLTWKLRDSNDIEHDRSFVSGAGDQLDPAFSLTPGGKQTGWIVFEIDQDASVKWLRADPNPFLKFDLYFDVQ